MKIVNWSQLSIAEQGTILQRPVLTSSSKTTSRGLTAGSNDVDRSLDPAVEPRAVGISGVVSQIIDRVRQEGDAALYDFTEKLDKVRLERLTVEINSATIATINAAEKTAIQLAIDQISAFHQACLPEPLVYKQAGLSLSRRYRPIPRVGLYIPGGRNTALVSSLMMQAIPAQLAGCPLRVLCTPPNSNGQLDARLLYTAKRCGIERIYQVGGAQAIAAMAYGTESIPKVNKIFGPGNAWVTEAKSQVAVDPQAAVIDMPAGPSEVMVMADEFANPAFVAADLLAQAEHGEDSQVILLATTADLAQRVQLEIDLQLPKLSRQAIIQSALRNSLIIIEPDLTTQETIVNAYAPEHLIVNRRDAADFDHKALLAGTLFLGPLAAETMGDYITGSNHVLPTNGYAKSCSGLGISDFMTAYTVQEINPQALQRLGPAACQLADIEGLDAHASAVRLRLASLEDKA